MLAILVIFAGATTGLWQLHKRGRLRQDCYRDFLALGALALATAAFFWPLLSSTEVWMPVGGGDLVSFLYPLQHFATRSLRAADLPLWNPYLYGGAPFAADNQSGLFYPLNLLLTVLRPQVDYRAMELLAAAHFCLAGVCAYFGLRHMVRPPLRRWAALAGAAAFMFSDLFVTHFGNLNLIATATWLPIIFCLFRRALDEVRWPLAVGAGVFLGLAALAGHIQPLLYIIATLGLYFLSHVYAHRDTDGAGLIRLLLLLVLTFAVFAGVAALAIVPAYEMSQLSLRAKLSYADASQYSLPPVALAGLAVPAVFGRGPGGYWGPWPRVETGYAGIFTLLLACAALVLRRDRLTHFLALLTVLGLFLALGGHAALHGWLYRTLPGFNLVRAPARAVYLLDFGLVALAALGLDGLLRPIPPDVRRIWRKSLRLLPWASLGAAILSLSVAYAVLLLSQHREPQVFARVVAGTSGLVLAVLFLSCSVTLLYLRATRRLAANTLGLLTFMLIVLDLASLGSATELEFSNPLSGFDHPAAIAFLKSDPDYYRIDTRTEVWDVWQPNLGLLHGIFDVWGIHNPLILADYHRYWESLGSRSSRLYDFLNVKYLIAHKDVTLDWSKFELAFDADPDVNVYRNTMVLPRALLVHNSWSVANQEGAFAAVHQPSFDPATMVVIERGTKMRSDLEVASQAGIVSYTNDEILVSTSAPIAGYLVLSEVYYPGWKALVDDQPADVERANYAFRAVYVPAGAHQVRLYFQPGTWRAALVCSVITWALLIASGLLLTIRRGQYSARGVINREGTRHLADSDHGG